MIVQSTNASSFYDEKARSPSHRKIPTVSQKNVVDTVRISQAAREMLATSSSALSSGSDKPLEARLADIRARGLENRNHEDQGLPITHDNRLAEITAQGQPPERLTAEELDYMQRAGGLVNTFAHLSPAEKALYDKAVASGNAAAAEGISKIALIRHGGEMAGGAYGTIYNPRTTEITAANIEKYFRHSIVDSSGDDESKFQALIWFLQSNLEV